MIAVGDECVEDLESDEKKDGRDDEERDGGDEKLQRRQKWTEPVSFHDSTAY